MPALACRRTRTPPAAPDGQLLIGWIMKPCTRCGAVLLWDAFRPAAQGPRAAHCADCARKAEAKSRSSPIYKDKHRLYMRDYMQQYRTAAYEGFADMMQEPLDPAEALMAFEEGRL